MAWRELRASPRQLGLLMAPITIGLAAVVAVQSFGDDLRSSVRRQSRALLGADLVLRSGTPLSERAEALLEELTRAAGQDDVALARVTSFAAMAFVPGGAGARLVQVAAIEDGYPFYGAPETEPPGEWSLFGDRAIVGPTLLAALGAQLGDGLALGEGRFQVEATVLNFPGDLGVRTAFGPRVFIPAKRLDETGLLGFGSRARHEVFLKLPQTVEPELLAERFRASLAAERVSLRTVTDDQRRLDRVLGRMTRFLGVVGLCALLLGGVGVASGVHVFVQRKRSTVAVLRCLGATAGQTLAVYLFQATAIGLVGSLAGVALGLAMQRLLPGVVEGFLPVDVVPQLSWKAVGAGVGIGLWVSAAFALLPLLTVRRVPPLAVLRQDYEPPPAGSADHLHWLAGAALAASVVLLAALQTGGLGRGAAFAGAIGVALGTLWLSALALVRGIRRFFPYGLPYLWRQGLANLYRPANQTVTVVLALGFGAFLLGTVLLVQRSLLDELSVDLRGERPNLVLIDIQPDQLVPLADELRQQGVTPAPAVPIVAMRIASVEGAPVSQVLGATGEEAPRGRWAFRREYRSTYRDRPTASERLIEGKWWQPGAWRTTPVASGARVPISIEAGVAEELGVGVGDEIVWDVQGIRLASQIVGLREVEWARFEPNFFVVFPVGPLDEAPQTFVSLARVEDPQRRGLLQRELMESFPNVSVLDLSHIQQALEDLIGRIALAIRFMALFSLATGVLVLFGAVAANRFQRVREAALLKTMGATRRQVQQIALAEYLFLGVLSAAVSLMLAAAAAWALMRFVFDTALRLPLLATLGLALGVVALTLAVGIWNSFAVFRRTPLQILRAE